MEQMNYDEWKQLMKKRPDTDYADKNPAVRRLIQNIRRKRKHQRFLRGQRH